MLAGMRFIPLPLLIALIPLAWLALMGVVVTACRAAARGDRHDARPTP
jgi:hypothetical protein